MTILMVQMQHVTDRLLHMRHLRVAGACAHMHTSRNITTFHKWREGSLPPSPNTPILIMLWRPLFTLRNCHQPELSTYQYTHMYVRAANRRNVYLRRVAVKTVAGVTAEEGCAAEMLMWALKKQPLLHSCMLLRCLCCSSRTLVRCRVFYTFQHVWHNK